MSVSQNNYLKIIFLNFFSVLLLWSLAIVPTAYAQVAFDKTQVFKDNDVYSLPEPFSSPEKIQSYLNSTGSILATYQVPIGLYSASSCANVNGQAVCYQTDPVAFASSFPGIPSNLVPANNLAPFNSQTMSVANFIWNLARTDFGSGCDYTYQSDICYQNSAKPINPAYVLSLIQKESRLVYGACSRLDADTNPACNYSSPSSIQKLGFRLDRATGYFCFETSVRANSCWDENQYWLRYKGFFRQVYHAVRRLRLLEEMCKVGRSYSFKNSAGDFKVGSTVRIDGQNILLTNGITCAIYVYTPHISNLQWLIMRDLNGFYDFRDEYNLPDNYTPKKVGF